jgi:SCP1.201-like deaminase
VKHPSTLTRWLDRRTLTALVAGTAVVTTAIYATNTNNNPPTATRQVATTGGVGHWAQVLTLPFDLTDLRQKVDMYTAIGTTNSTDPLQETTQLISFYQIDVDPNRLQPFLDQAAIAFTPQQVTDYANAFLVQQGVPQTTIDQAMANIATLQYQEQEQEEEPEEPQGQQEGQESDWLVRLIIAIAAVLAAALAFANIAANSSGDQDEKRPACDEDALKQALLDPNKVPPRPSNDGPTAGYGVDNAGMEYQFESGYNKKATVNGQPMMDGYLVDKAQETLRQRGMRDITGRANHVEPKMAMYMNLKKIDEVCMVINNVDGPCPRAGEDLSPKGCRQTVPVLLGKNSRGVPRLLQVFWMDKAIGWTSEIFPGS